MSDSRCALPITFLGKKSKKSNSNFLITADVGSRCCKLLSNYYFRSGENNFEGGYYHPNLSCELLSNYYFRSGENNEPSFFNIKAPVVNCFQIIIFAVAKTTTTTTYSTYWRLWIAFKLLFSQWRKQRWNVFSRCRVCCELLSNYYFRSGENNYSVFVLSNVSVVNCFQIIIFAVAKTTNN